MSFQTCMLFVCGMWILPYNGNGLSEKHHKIWMKKIKKTFDPNHVNGNTQYILNVRTTLCYFNKLDSISSIYHYKLSLYVKKTSSYKVIFYLKISMQVWSDMKVQTES